MSTLEVYDSQGNSVGDGSVQQNGRIEELFFDGVRLLVDTSNGYELTLFFRARDSEAGRAEQYYAVYHSEKSTGLFQRFEHALRQEVEDNQDMIIETSTDDAQLLSLLATDPELPDTDQEHNSISSMLAEGRQMTIGVASPKAAFALVRHYFSSPVDRIVIVDEITDDTMIEYDFAIEYGSYTGIEPVGEVAEAFNERLRRTTANSTRPRASSTGAAVQPSYFDRVKTISKESLAILFGAVLMTAILVLLINGAAVAGITIPSTDPLILV